MSVDSDSPKGVPLKGGFCYPERSKNQFKLSAGLVALLSLIKGDFRGKLSMSFCLVIRFVPLG